MIPVSGMLRVAAKVIKNNHIITDMPTQVQAGLVPENLTL